MGAVITLVKTYPFISLTVVGSIMWKIRPIFQSRKNIWNGKEMNWLEKLLYGGIADFAKDWHDYEVHDLDRLVKNKSNCLLIGYHSRSTLDLIYLTATIQCHLLVTHLLFYIPIIGNMLPLLRIIPSKGGVRGTNVAEESFISTLTEGERPLMLLPGGAVECMKAYHNRYRVLWKEEPGFSRVIHMEPSLQQNTKVIPFYTKNSELSLWSNAWWYTQSGRGVLYLMDQFRGGQLGLLPIMMIMLLCSLGFFPLPSPCIMDTYFGEEIIIRDNESSTEFANRVKTELHSLIDRVNGLKQRKRKRKLHPLYFFFLGVFTLLQNLLMHTAGISTLLFLGYPLLTIVQVLTNLFRRKKSSSKIIHSSKKEEKVDVIKEDNSKDSKSSSTVDNISNLDDNKLKQQ
jgi:1-acyl-sn-glycerol-3-phosphate acyltransferase